jgi:hypothetical protein
VSEPSDPDCGSEPESEAAALGRAGAFWREEEAVVTAAGLRVLFDEDAVALTVFLATLEGGLALVDADTEVEGPAVVMVSRGRGGLKGRRRRFWVPCRSGGIFIEYLTTGSSAFSLVVCVCCVF